MQEARGPKMSEGVGYAMPNLAIPLVDMKTAPADI